MDKSEDIYHKWYAKNEPELQWNKSHSSYSLHL